MCFLSGLTKAYYEYLGTGHLVSYGCVKKGVWPLFEPREHDHEPVDLRVHDFKGPTYMFAIFPSNIAVMIVMP